MAGVNRCADKLAKIGAKQVEQSVKMLIPPDEVIQDTLVDMGGVAYPRWF